MTTKAGILRAIRQKCLECSCQQPSEVRACPITACELWPFRLGEDPEPSPTRGFAKPPVYTGKALPQGAGGLPDTGSAPLLSKSPVYTGHSADQGMLP